MAPQPAASEPTGSGSLSSTFVHDFLPTFAMAAGLLAAIWLACAIIATVGTSLGLFVFHGAHALIRTVIRWIWRGWGGEYAQLVTVNADGVTTTPVNPRRARADGTHSHLHPAASHGRATGRARRDPGPPPSDLSAWTVRPWLLAQPPQRARCTRVAMVWCAHVTKHLPAPEPEAWSRPSETVGRVA